MLARAGQFVRATCSCGTHAPGYFDARGEVPPPPPYSPLAHNCSGKHSGMLAYCVQCGLPQGDLTLRDEHPLQQAIRRAVAHFTATPEAELVAGIDGCSAPNYAVPLAPAGACVRAPRIGADRRRLRRRAPRVLADAMTAHPEMVSGEHRSDLDADAAPGAAIGSPRSAPRACRRSALRGAGSVSRSRSSTANRRVLRPIVASVLDQLGLLDATPRARAARRLARAGRPQLPGNPDRTGCKSDRCPGQRSSPGATNAAEQRRGLPG